MVQFIKFLVKILDVYIGEMGSCFNTCLSKHKRDKHDLKPINLANLKEDDLNKKLALVKHCFNCEHRFWKF